MKKVIYIFLIESKVKRILKNYDSKLIVKERIEPKINKTNIEFLENIPTKKKTKCFLTEASAIDKNSIILGPGPDTSHQKNEYVLYDSLKKTVELYEEIIKYYNDNKKI